MRPMNLHAVLVDNVDAVIGSTASVGTTLSLAAVQPMDPNNHWTFLSYIPAIVGPTLLVLVNRHLASKAARKHARAEFLRQEAKADLKDKDKSNDAAARDKLLEAAELDAEAEALKHPR